LGTTFLGIEGAEWYTLYIVKGITWYSGLAGSTYYFTTGLDAAHLICGLLLIAYVIRKGLLGGYSKDNTEGVGNVVLYWIFVNVIWLFIFPLFYLI
jgi:cytochrome c oxidase subunit 3